ncbi:DUF6705 family protein [uncultured Kordia sp.]|uniref:DUF6705 family protein n=1 Tax=uncultured Kordia sp. TaxID=507699 RepID=UPI00260160B7|nr:DUF6705 family protein [uncultured Kordia sp.]
MKKIILIITLILNTSCILLSAQTTATTNINTPFVGTWQWQNGNQTFQVELFLNENGRIRGHFTMLETNSNGLQIIVYKSNRDIGFGHTFGSVIYGSSDGTILYAGIDDNTVPNPNNYPGLSGKLKMEIITTGNCIGCSTTATWKVKEQQEGRFEGDNRTLNIPTDIILTKVN